MHGPIREQGEWLKQVVSGFSNYHAVPTNVRTLVAFRYHVTDLWRRTLRRRGQKHRLTWERIGKLADHWLPTPRLLHPWPNQRFAVTHPRWEPDAGGERKAGMSLPVKAWSVQRRAGRTGAR